MKAISWIIAGGVCASLAGIVAATTPPDAQILEKENVVDSAKLHEAWLSARPIQSLDVYEQVRTGALSRSLLRMLDNTTARLDENSQIAILPATISQRKAALDLRKGQIYVRDRERRGDLEIHLPGGVAIPNGTEFQIAIAGGAAVVTPLEGTVDLSNQAGTITVAPGERGFIEAGRKPYKTAAIYAKNDVIQWVLYYPAVLDLREIGLSAASSRTLRAALECYEAGDLLGALVSWPRNYSPASNAERLFRAATLLAVGRVPEAERLIGTVPRMAPARLALEEMIAAVKFHEHEVNREPSSAGEWLARSYYDQSQARLAAALDDARRATAASPGFGYAWERVAELEFSFGRNHAAETALARSLSLSPRNAQAHALDGFLKAAANEIGQAHDRFDAAIALDGALANAWLGRGLTEIRKGHSHEGCRDLEAAAGLEPSRSLLHSYLGKAFSQGGAAGPAHDEFTRAIALDPHDPTPWLYSAIQNKQENRYNTAIADLEKSVELNDNRRIYRSRLLLDQDQSVRGTNLAAIYRDDGMVEQSVREAVRAVNTDYASAASHLFLANSYDALRDPNRILLRYETPWFNELLLANLLSPVGGGPLSQFVSQQEYSKLFEHDGLGLSSLTQYYGSGKVLETASQYGTFGNVSYAIDSQYQSGAGLYQANSDISRLENYAQIKLQLSRQDTIFLQAKTEQLRNGNLFQQYDPQDAAILRIPAPDGSKRLETIPNRANLSYSFHETQDPGLLLAGYHHEWSPGNHTLLLLGRLENRQSLTADDTNQNIVVRESAMLPDPGQAATDPWRDPAFIANLRGSLHSAPITDLVNGKFDADYHASFETYSVELQQIMTFGPTTLLLGGRYQNGEFQTKVTMGNFANGTQPQLGLLFDSPPAHQDVSVGLERFSLYAYDVWHVTPWLSVTGGVTFDQLTYPDDFRNPPVTDQQRRLSKLLPKVGIILEPWSGATIRAAYAQSISGSSFDESVRLEPTQVAGFLQSYRSLASESLIASVAGSKYEIYGVSLEQKLPSRTYLGAELGIRTQKLDRTIGAFDEAVRNGLPLAFLPSSFPEKDTYRETALAATANQLIGDCWSLAARYRYTLADLHQEFPEFRSALSDGSGSGFRDLVSIASLKRESGLHEVSIVGLFNHPSGFFARAEANWYEQANHDLVERALDPSGSSRMLRTVDLGPASDEFWQFNVFAGYRFFRNQCEVSCGILNLAGQDYRLYPLDPYEALPRKRTFFAECRVSF